MIKKGQKFHEEDCKAGLGVVKYSAVSVEQYGISALAAATVWL